MTVTRDLAALTAPSSTPPPIYNGFRFDRTWLSNGTDWTAVDTPHPFGDPGNFANAPIPENVLPDDGTINIGTTLAPNLVPINPATPNEIQRQANAGTYLNRSSFTAPIVYVPADQPLVRCECIYRGIHGPHQMREMTLGMGPIPSNGVNGRQIAGGVPIPDDYIEAPSGDTDGEVLIYQPDYVSPVDGSVGRYYEFWKLHRNPSYDPTLPEGLTNPKWTTASAGRTVGLNKSPNHYVTHGSSYDPVWPPGAGDSTFSMSGWGVSASGIFLASDMVSREDCVLGRIDHAVGLLLNNSKHAHVWPAMRDDGRYANRPVMEGQRLYFPPSVVKPVFTNRFASMLFDAAQKYGFVIDDATNASIGVRVEPTSTYGYAPEATALMDGVPGFSVLKQMPWSKLVVIKPGTDATPNPTST